MIRWNQAEPGFITYSAEKTIADLLRLERRLGRDVYLEGLKNYLARPDRDLLDRLRHPGQQQGLPLDTIGENVPVFWEVARQLDWVTTGLPAILVSAAAGEVDTP